MVRTDRQSSSTTPRSPANRLRSSSGSWHTKEDMYCSTGGATRNWEATENAESDWEWMLKCVAGLAMIEFRIELMPAKMGYPPAPSTTVDSIDEHLGITNAETFAA